MANEVQKIGVFMQRDIKETKELIAGVKEAVKLGKKIRDIVADGIDSSDLPKAFELVKEQSAKIEIYNAARKDIVLVKEEIKDLSKEELIEIVLSIVTAVSEVEAA